MESCKRRQCLVWWIFIILRQYIFKPPFSMTKLCDMQCFQGISASLSLSAGHGMFFDLGVASVWNQAPVTNRHKALSDWQDKGAWRVMKEIGIKETAGQIREIADEKLSSRKGCITFTDSEIGLCVKDEPGYHKKGVTFDVATPRLVLTAVTNIVNRIVFNLSPAQSSAIVASTVPNATSLPRNQQQFVHQH